MYTGLCCVTKSKQTHISCTNMDKSKISFNVFVYTPSHLVYLQMNVFLCMYCIYVTSLQCHTLCPIYYFCTLLKKIVYLFVINVLLNAELLFVCFTVRLNMSY
ncbi:hypothetical protein GDO86_015387 [Hymenochirus boettgeri]|uniref:Uncharacterized protein n=1 Tax=Hymenochirus boettgeri TaxID=247094 RepID=A0A8T2JX76_9PIPI|nr:hypothetical protein GDO86_015387 [Hymenochirus boettgeri]